MRPIAVMKARSMVAILANTRHRLHTIYKENCVENFGDVRQRVAAIFIDAQ
jgi:hypothetical protein